jgi:hypothetical protein
VPGADDLTLNGDGMSDVFVRVEVPFGRDGSNDVSESDMLFGCRFRSRTHNPQAPSDTDIVRDPVTGGNRIEREDIS